MPIEEMGFITSPERRGRTSSHHSHFTSTRFAKNALTLHVRNLERHQFTITNTSHRHLHDNYLPPELPTEEQAAREIINAYDQSERFKIYDCYVKQYMNHEIPKELVDSLVARYSLIRVFDMAAD